jgi:hypothetical protein
VRFDWSSAINQSASVCPNPNPCHRRDFVFNVGTAVLITDPAFRIQSSSNAFRPGANPNVPCPNPATPPNSCRPPAFITLSGWYTFRHTFHDDGAGFLAVDFDIFKLGSDTSFAHWTIDSNPYDPMSMVGGNRYGWFANEEIPELAIDNSLRTGLCREGDGQGNFQGDHGNGNFQFDSDGCLDGDRDSVSSSNRGDGKAVQSTSIKSIVRNALGNTMTITGTASVAGLPVGFVMVAVESTPLTPGWVSFTFTDGYSNAGRLLSGNVLLH